MNEPGGPDQARFLRPRSLAGVEALHASFLRHRYPPHIHDSLTLAYVDRGAATFRLEGERYLAPAGCLFLIPPQAVHTGEAANPGGYTYHVLYLDPGWFAEHAGGQRIRFRWRRSLTVMRNRSLAHALARVHRALTPPADGLELPEALTPLTGILQTLATESEPRQHPPEHRAVRSARAYIDERWSEDFTLTELAAAADLSPFHLCRLFTRQVGMPPSAYRRSRRLEHARRLLRAGEPVVRVAATCGFHDQAHLSRHFKQTNGVTPARYARA